MPLPPNAHRLTLDSGRHAPADLVRALRQRWPELVVVYAGEGLTGDRWITGFHRPNEHRRVTAGQMLAHLEEIAKKANAEMKYKASPTQWDRAFKRLALRYRWWTLLREGFVAVHDFEFRGECDARIERKLLEADWGFYHEGDRRYEALLDEAEADEDPQAMATRIRETLKGMDMYGYWRKRTHALRAA